MMRSAISTLVRHPLATTAMIVFFIVVALFTNLIIHHHNIRSIVQFAESTDSVVTLTSELPDSLSFLSNEWRFHGFDTLEFFDVRDEKLSSQLFGFDHQIQSLVLYSCELDDETAKSLFTSPRLTSLQLGFDEQIALFRPYASACQAMWQLHLSGASIDDALIEDLEQLPNLTHVRFARTSRLTKRGFESVSRMSNLEGLQLADLSLDDASLNEISSLPLLEYLSISSCKGLDDSNFEWVTSFPRLQELAIYDTQLSKYALQKIASCSGLVTLSVGNVGMTDDGLELLSDGTLNNVEAVYINDTPDITEGGIRKLIVSLKSIRYMTINFDVLRGVNMSKLEEDFPEVIFHSF